MKFLSIACVSVCLMFTTCAVKQMITSDSPVVQKLKKNISLTNSRWEALRSMADLDSDKINSWVPESGIRGRYEIAKKYLSKSIVEGIVGEKAFLEGPHSDEVNFRSLDEFGHYNPVFVTKVKNILTTLLQEKGWVSTLQSVYDKELQQYLRIYYLSYEVAANNKDVVNEYKAIVARQPHNSAFDGFLSEPSLYLQDTFEDFSAGLIHQGYDVYEGVTCPGFWVRRSVDGTADEFYELLKVTMMAFDADFFTRQE